MGDPEERRARIENLVEALHDEIAPGMQTTTQLKAAVVEALKRINDKPSADVSPSHQSHAAPCRRIMLTTDMPHLLIPLNRLMSRMPRL